MLGHDKIEIYIFNKLQILNWLFSRDQFVCMLALGCLVWPLKKGKKNVRRKARGNKAKVTEPSKDSR